MKKLFIILVVVALIVAMAVPVFATDGITDEELVSNLPAPFNHNYYTFFVMDGEYHLFVSQSPSVYSSEDASIGFEGYCQLYVYSDGMWSLLFFDIVSPSQERLELSCVKLASYVIKDAQGGIVFAMSNLFRKEFCNCNFPLVDKNGDNRCDICTGEFSVNVALDTFFGLTVPSLSSVWTDKKKYSVAAIYQVKSSGKCGLVLADSFEIDYVHTAEYGESYYKTAAAYELYNLIGNEWQKSTEGTGSLILSVETTNLIWASETIYTDSTRVHDFFGVPPTMAGIVTETMLTAALTEIVAILPMMMVLLVGYLALRKALRVLERVLYQA